MNTELIKKGYNQIAQKYQNERNMLRSGKYLQKFLQLLSPQSYILDLGCGSGDPIDKELIKQDHLVIGLDISPVQIGLAKKNCPTGSFYIRDIQTLQENEFTVDAVVSFYAFFHIPREKHLKLLQTVNSFLPIGGLVLLTMGDTDFEGYHKLYGVHMWSSQYNPQKNAQIVVDAGFEIISNTIDSSGKEKHQILLCRKNKKFGAKLKNRT